MKKAFKLIGIIAIAAVIGFSFTGCDQANDPAPAPQQPGDQQPSGQVPANPFVGTWVFMDTWPGGSGTYTLNIVGTNWTLTFVEVYMGETSSGTLGSGSFTHSGNTATVMGMIDGDTFSGTAMVMGTTLTLNIPGEGSMSFTRQP